MSTISYDKRLRGTTPAIIGVPDPNDSFLKNHYSKSNKNFFMEIIKNEEKNTDPWQQTTVPPLRVILVLLSSSHLSNAIKDRKKSPPVH